MADLYLFVLFWISLVSAEIRGIDPTQTGRYDKPVFSCFDASKEIPYEAVNDDYCDCLDGSDEPGTSACARGQFYCRNKGYRPAFIPSAFVDDGVCDCCDGTDEKEKHCNHTCYALGEQIRTELHRKIGGYERSLKEKQRRIDEAEGIKEKWKEELKTCEDDREKQRERSNAVKARLDAIEAEERRREEAETEAEEAEKTINATQMDNRTMDGEQTDPDEDDADGDSKVEWDGSDAGDHEGEEEDSAEEDSHEDEDQHEASYGVEEADDADDPPRGPDDEEEAFQDEESDEEASDDEDASPRPFLHRLKRWGRSLWPSKQKPVETVEADSVDPVKDIEIDQARKEHSRESRELRTLEKRCSDLKTKIDRHYGSDGRLISLVDRCFEGKHDKYVYVICPFDKADQKDGGKHVHLGKFDGLSDDDTVMHFKHGQRCPGKQRSLTVTLTCGENETVVSVLEPAVCEYTAELSTPVACTAAGLKELKIEAESMGIEQKKETRTETDTIKDEL